MNINMQFKILASWDISLMSQDATDFYLCRFGIDIDKLTKYIKILHLLCQKSQ